MNAGVPSRRKPGYCCHSKIYDPAKCQKDEQLVFTSPSVYGTRSIVVCGHLIGYFTPVQHQIYGASQQQNEAYKVYCGMIAALFLFHRGGLLSTFFMMVSYRSADCNESWQKPRLHEQPMPRCGQDRRRGPLQFVLLLDIIKRINCLRKLGAICCIMF